MKTSRDASDGGRGGGAEEGGDGSGEKSLGRLSNGITTELNNGYH